MSTIRNSLFTDIVMFVNKQWVYYFRNYKGLIINKNSNNLIGIKICIMRYVENNL